MSDALAKARERTEGEGLVGVFVDRQEFTAMLDVIEAAEWHRECCDRVELSAALDHYNTLLGDDE